VANLLGGLERTPEWAILGCTQYPLIADLFRAALPAETRLLDQPKVVANALEDYLERKPELDEGRGQARYFTTGKVAEVRRVAAMLVGEEVDFKKI
jgi:glutamate racemase